MTIAHHPVADLFPMMTEEELADLAADIAERGLLHAIVLDQEGRILDGRNRYAACQIAGFEPLFETYTRADSAGYALAVNVQRRNLTKGQMAMIAAKAWSISDQSRRSMERSTGVSHDRMFRASVVLEYAPGLADSVVAGATTLDEAYAEARKRKAEDEGDEARLNLLRSKRPDLADKVVEGELTLTAAIAAESADREAARRSAVAYLGVVYRPALALRQLFDGQEPETIAAQMSDYRDMIDTVTPDDLDAAASGLAQLAAEWRKHEAD